MEFAQKHADRVAHVHLKDVSTVGMLRVKNEKISYFDAIVADELYRPLGQGDVDVRAIVTGLVDGGYDGWYVLEQDKVVRTDPAPGEGPLLDAQQSVGFLRGVLAIWPRRAEMRVGVAEVVLIGRDAGRTEAAQADVEKALS